MDVQNEKNCARKSMFTIVKIIGYDNVALWMRSEPEWNMSLKDTFWMFEVVCLHSVRTVNY